MGIRDVLVFDISDADADADADADLDAGAAHPIGDYENDSPIGCNRVIVAVSDAVSMQLLARMSAQGNVSVTAHPF
ncbi:hypothetical protein DSL72_002522 [Monilinia vaccinii-corymbosi]|uniref:Uncharacterized protein n=1 Tax=Monilinia vaccinii-corymbosi TaxID=61207 RepID=A0A8A3PCX9_9HELO|nr:hypothetical protein DSL72_002522 [Monilinia vaccinii-corymbosi]